MDYPAVSLGDHLTPSTLDPNKDLDRSVTEDTVPIYTLTPLWFILVGFLVLLVIKYCQSNSVELPPTRQLYREPPLEISPWTTWVQPEGKLELDKYRFEPYSGTLPISVNWQLTETIVTNPHVFVAFILPHPYSALSSSLVESLVGVAATLEPPPDSVRRVIVVANCSADSSMAIKHKVNKFPTIAYYRHGYYYCDFYGDPCTDDIFPFVVSIVSHEFPSGQ